MIVYDRRHIGFFHGKMHCFFVFMILVIYMSVKINV